MKKTTQKIPIMRKNHTIDAQSITLGRLASKTANLLRGKHKTTYQPNIDGGDFVILTNASKIKVTGKKIEQKEYYHHTRYPGGLKTDYLKDLIKTRPEKVIKNAVFHMIPKNRLRNNMMKRLTIIK